MSKKRTRKELARAHGRTLEICCIRDDQIDDLKKANINLQEKLKEAYRVNYKNEKLFDFSLFGYRFIASNRFGGIYKMG